MVKMFTFESRPEWLKARTRIGGSEAAAIVGANPYLTNVELWERKMGLSEAEDISDKPFIQYGNAAEPLLRQLFALDHPDWTVGYVPHNLFVNDDYPFAHVSLDSWLTDEQERRGVLEIKTSNILSAAQNAKWDGKIPDNYYCQVLWEMAVYDAEFAVLAAQLKWERKDGEVFKITREYKFERSDCEEDIAYLMEAGKRFWEYLEKGERPPRSLPL